MRTRTSVVPFAFLNKRYYLGFRHPFGFKVLQTFQVSNLSATNVWHDGEGDEMMTTNRLMQISAGSERLEVRRYEDTDEGVDLEWIQKHCVERTDQGGSSKIGCAHLSG